MKRKRSTHGPDKPPKRPRTADAPTHQSPAATPVTVQHPVLNRLYPNVLSLRHYVLSRLPASSKFKSRRRKLSQIGRPLPSHADSPTCDTVDLELGELLDSTLVGVSPGSHAQGPETDFAKERDEQREKDLETFTQALSLANSASTLKPGSFDHDKVSPYLRHRRHPHTAPVVTCDM